jgi:hypothetical protein
MKTKPQEFINKLSEVNSWLFYGDVAKVVKRSGKSLTYVSRVLAGKHHNETIIQCAIEVMEENKVKFNCAQPMKVA